MSHLTPGPGSESFVASQDPSGPSRRTGEAAYGEGASQEREAASVERTQISLDGYNHIQLIQGDGYHGVSYVQLYTGFVVGSTRRAETEQGGQYVEGSALLNAWRNLAAGILELSQVWITDRHRAFNQLVSLLPPIVRLPCEGYHLLVYALCVSFSWLDAQMPASEEAINVLDTPYDRVVIQKKWIALRPLMEVLRRHLNDLCTAAGLDGLPEGAVLRVVSDEQYENEGYRVCGYSVATGSLVHFDE
jgi:hypothetical protein